MISAVYEVSQSPAALRKPHFKRSPCSLGLQLQEGGLVVEGSWTTGSDMDVRWGRRPCELADGRAWGGVGCALGGYVRARLILRLLNYGRRTS